MANINKIEQTLREEGYELEDLNYGDWELNPVEELLHDKNIIHSEFSPNRYPAGGALFIQHDLLTLDWDDDDPEDLLKDVLHYLQQDIEYHPGHIWEIQETRHGYHAVLLTELEVPENLIMEWGEAMDVDLGYLALRKGDKFDWRVTPKFLGADKVCLPHSRIGNGNGGNLKWGAETLLRKYYAAVEWCKKKILEEPEFLRGKSEDYLIRGNKQIEDWLESQNFYHWESWGKEFQNPFTGEIGYQVQVYKDKEDSQRGWWTWVFWLP